MKFEKAPDGSWIRTAERPPVQARGQGQMHLGATFSKPMMSKPTYTTGTSSQSSFTKLPHTEIPSQAPHAPDHAPWMDLSTQISSLGTRMEDLAVSIEERMDQQQTTFEHFQQMIERIESRHKSQHEEMMAYLRSVFPLPQP
ncbi:hypothetical protein AAG906_008168 [Vitis piasezkii]